MINEDKISPKTQISDASSTQNIDPQDMTDMKLI